MLQITKNRAGSNCDILHHEVVIQAPSMCLRCVGLGHGCILKDYVEKWLMLLESCDSSR
jgi:hypothetical protein